MIFGISAHGSVGYNAASLSIDDCFMESGSSDSPSFTPLGAFGGGDLVSTISSYWAVASAVAFNARLEDAR